MLDGVHILCIHFARIELLNSNLASEFRLILSFGVVRSFDGVRPQPQIEAVVEKPEIQPPKRADSSSHLMTPKDHQNKLTTK